MSNIDWIRPIQKRGLKLLHGSAIPSPFVVGLYEELDLNANVIAKSTNR